MAQTTFREHIQSIEDAISVGQIDDAMSRCQQILSSFPESLEIQRLLGEVYLAQGRLEEAQQTFDWILVNDPENVIAYCDRALICEHLADIETALDCYQQAYELSRGNSQIRQEFNQLSAKAGQQEFMLSRAGLARLYMRGDLLTQAIQEWEAVLSTTPDRLDARMGLMEACWREGLHDQVEQLASRILEEIPNCEKALLLLAHIASPSNMSRARELLQRAELLDPELVMAQELFGDLVASQPNDPFLLMVKREPIILEQQTNGNGKHLEAINTFHYPAVDVKQAALASQEALTDRRYNWNAQDSLSELDTRMTAQSETLSTQESSDRATWLDDTNIQQVDTSDNQAEQNQPADDFDAWASQQEIDDDYDPALLEQRPWFQAEQATAAHSNEETQNVSQPDQLAANDPWNEPTPSRKEEVPAAPAWLDMLTKNERGQTGANIPASHAQESLLPASQPQKEAKPTPAHSWEDESRALPASLGEEVASPFLFASDDKEEDMGWPEWLKSLGAETIKPEPEPAYNAWTDLQQPVPSATPGNAPFDDWRDQPPAKPAASQPAETTSYNLWAAKPEEGLLAEQAPADYSTWEDQIEHTMSGSEQEHLATLETLEQSLLSKGFVPLQPGSLSTIANESGLAASSDPSSKIDTVAESSINPVPPVAPKAPAEQPVWSSALSQAPAQGKPVEADDEPTATNIPAERIRQETRTPALAMNRAEQAAPEIPLAAAYRPDALLENELETTMRRPAVRLQPIKAVVRTDQAYPAGKGQTTFSGGRGKLGASDGKLSNKEQLVKGYQYQLAGAYDDAMQEYRITIRNAPELLDVVISNLRALLKLAPKYTAGYRVLGDAYMRQGEYIQAMEAYNKALTIAKKAKSQSH